MKVTVTILRRPEIADPQGSTVRRALQDLGFEEAEDVRIDRVIRLDVNGEDVDTVRSRVEEMCRQLLANPVLEDFEIQIEP